MGRVVRKAVVAVLVGYALFTIYAAASAFWQPVGTLGFSTDYDANVRSVSPGGPAWLAGMVAGDRLDLAATPFSQRRFIAGVGAAMPVGTTVDIALRDRGITRQLHLEAVRATMSASDRSSLLLECAAALVFIAVGAALILVRPGLATWGFGLYCLILLPTYVYPLRQTSAGTAVAAIFLFDVVQNIGVVGLLVFALEFPRPYDTLWRAIIRRSLPAIFVGLSAMTLFPDVANLLWGKGAEFENRILQLAAGSVFGLALFIVYDTYWRTAIKERERLQWVLLALGIGTITSYVGNTLLFSTLIPIAPSAALINVLVSLDVLVPLAVAHAVVRHRVLDIDFVVGRALAYATLTTMLATLFELLDWAFGHVLEDFRLSRLAEAAISVAIAFAFASIHKRSEAVIESVFNRNGRVESLLSRLANGLLHVRNIAEIETALVGDVIEALGLTSAALFRPTGSTMERVASHGWRATDRKALAKDDLLIVSLISEPASIMFEDEPHCDGMPTGTAAPIVAIPLVTRLRLVGVVFYGSHAGGARIDRDELALLERLVHSAAIAFDELETERLRLDLHAKASTIEDLKARIDELQRVESVRESLDLHAPLLEAGGRHEPERLSGTPSIAPGQSPISPLAC